MKRRKAEKEERTVNALPYTRTNAPGGSVGGGGERERECEKQKGGNEEGQ
jgi:hypothetical protein